MLMWPLLPGPTRVNERDLYSAAGSAAVNEYTWTVYEDGVEIDTFKYEDDNDLMPSRSSSDRWNGTGNGILTEVFVDSQEDQVIVTKINTYLAEVTKVEENEDDYTVTVSYKTSPSGSVSREFDTTTEFAREDIVLVTLAGESGNTKEIQSLTSGRDRKRHCKRCSGFRLSADGRHHLQLQLRLHQQ